MANNYSREEILDELLCEYVDGTIDQTVRAAFDECLSSDKSLAERVECLRRTRRMLKQYRCRQTRDVHLRVRQRLLREVLAFQDDVPVWRSLNPFLGAGAIAALVLSSMVLTGTAERSMDDTFAVPQMEATNEVRMSPLSGPAPTVPVLLGVGPPFGVAALDAVP